MTPRGNQESGYVLIDALVAVVIVSMAGVGIYQFGTSLLNRSATDLSGSAAITNLHAMSLLIGARGEGALSLLPTEDASFRYSHRTPAEATVPPATDRFEWVEIVATDREGREREALVVGYVR